MKSAVIYAAAGDDATVLRDALEQAQISPTLVTNEKALADALTRNPAMVVFACVGRAERREEKNPEQLAAQCRAVKTELVDRPLAAFTQIQNRLSNTHVVLLTPAPTKAADRLGEARELARLSLCSWAQLLSSQLAAQRVQVSAVSAASIAELATMT